MDRRDLFRLLGATAAATGLSPARLAALVAGDGPRTASRAFFTAEQRETVAAIADAIIPPTDTPGAVDAGVVEFIELIVSEWYDADDRDHFMRGLAHIDHHSVSVTGVRFPHSEPAQQTAILSGLEAEGRALMAAGGDTPTPFFQRVRALVLHGYYTSEIGMTEEVGWQPIPGRFDGCANVSDVIRTTEERG